MLNTSNTLLNTIGDSAKKAKDATVRAATQEAGKFSDQATKQVTPSAATSEQMNNTRQEVEGIYGGKEAVMDPAIYNKKAIEEKKQTSGLIQQILGQLVPSNKMQDDRKQRMGSEHKMEAEELGQARDDQKQQVEQKKQQEEAEEQQKKDMKKAKLEQQVEAPQGKTTGMSFGRKKSAPRMQTPPSAETRGGKGNRE